MSENEEDGLTRLMDLQKKLERQKYIQTVVIGMREELFQSMESLGDDNISQIFTDFMINDERRYRRMMRDLRRRRDEHVREFINKEEILVSNAKHLEAVIFLKRKGWTGMARIHQIGFARELAVNHIPILIRVPD